jgi:hypothetical protein
LRPIFSAASSIDTRAFTSAKSMNGTAASCESGENVRAQLYHLI